MQELLAWIPEVKEIAREAGRILHEIYRGGQFERQLKEDATPVTSADLAADAYLKQALAALTPHVPVLTEEAATSPSASVRTGASTGWWTRWTALASSSQAAATSPP